MARDLLALSRAEQHRAKRLHVLRAVAHLATFVASACAVFVPEPAPYLAALAVVVAEGIALVLRVRGSEAHELAERGRRHALIADALARSDAPERANLVLRFGSYATKHANAFADSEYWSSTAKPGAARLRDHVQESAFWSADLYRWAGRAGLGFLLGPIVAVLLGVFLILGLDKGTLAVNAARIFSVLVLFLISLDLLNRALAWLNAAEVSKDVANAFDRPTTEDVPGALSAFADYSVATATAPPIPAWAYHIRKDRLEVAWQSRGNS